MWYEAGASSVQAFHVDSLGCMLVPVVKHCGEIDQSSQSSIVSGVSINIGDLSITSAFSGTGVLVPVRSSKMVVTDRGVMDICGGVTDACGTKAG